MGYGRISCIALCLLSKLIVVNAHALEAFVLSTSKWKQKGRGEGGVVSYLILESFSAKVSPTVQHPTYYQGDAPKNDPPAISIKLVGKTPTKSSAA
jgi:hypothetical protein